MRPIWGAVYIQVAQKDLLGVRLTFPVRQVHLGNKRRALYADEQFLSPRWQTNQTVQH